MAATDGYEAAMRAADALFSPRSASAAPPGAADHAATSVTGEGAVPASDPRPSGQHPASAHDAGETVGRVLRALDEPEAEPLEMLADEPAPKRRGRKPGSSNKPKLPPAIHRREGGPAAFADGGAGATSAAALLTAAAPQAEATDAPRQDEAAPAEASRSVGRGTPSVTARRREPFAWVRTKLRPGEKWKRRLPKVAW